MFGNAAEVWYRCDCVERFYIFLWLKVSTSSCIKTAAFLKALSHQFEHRWSLQLQFFVSLLSYLSIMALQLDLCLVRTVT